MIFELQFELNLYKIHLFSIFSEFIDLFKLNIMHKIFFL